MDTKIQLQEIIAKYVPVNTRIDFSKQIKDRYIPAELKGSFCDDICDQWKSLDSTDLFNEMFDSLETGNDIIEYIIENKDGN